MATSFFNNNCADDVEEIESAKNFADLARDWAIKLDGQVDGIDFSSKFWALQAAESSAAKIVVEDDGVPLGSDFNVLNFGVGISVLQTAANEVQIQASGDVFTEIFVDGVDYTAGTSTDIVLSEDPVSEKNIGVYFDGVRQQTDTYDVSGTMVTFTAAIPVGVGSIEVVRPRTLDVGVATAQNILYGTTGVTGDNFFDQALLAFDNVADMDAATWLKTGMRCRILGYTTPGGGGANDFEIGTGFGTADNGSVFDLSGSGLQAKGLFPGGIMNIRQFGAVGDGVTDDTAAIQNAINVAIVSGGTVFVPAGNYLITSGLTIIQSFVKLVGEGRQLSIITSNSTSDPCITVTTFKQAVEISGITFSRSSVPLNGADGLVFQANVNNCRIKDCHIEKHHVGVSVTATAYSSIQDCVIEECVSDGFECIGDGATSACQWNLMNVLSVKNGGGGFRWQATAGAAQMIVGEMVNCKTALNSGRGVFFVGLPSVPLQDVRIINGFFGSDGNDEVHLDTYGKQHSILDTFVELAGRTNTGPTLSTAPSNIGDGIMVTVNNDDVLIDGCTASGLSDSGILIGATDAVVSSCKVISANLAASGGSAYRTLKVNNVIFNSCISKFTTQIYGIDLASGSGIIINGCNLSGFATAPINAASGLFAAHVMACLPTSVTLQFSTNGVIAGNPTGGNKGAGTINIAAGIFKNNVAYTNP